jgi:hypothetical protein
VTPGFTKWWIPVAASGSSRPSELDDRLGQVMTEGRAAEFVADDTQRFRRQPLALGGGQDLAREVVAGRAVEP